MTCSRCPRPATFSRRVSVTGRSEGLCEPCARKVIAHVDAAVARLERARPQRSTLDVEVPA